MTANRAARFSPLAPIFKPETRFGSVAVGNTPPAPTDPVPVLAFDSRDWAGGTAVPTTSAQTPAAYGTIPNTGSAGSAYDITVWMRFFEDGVDGWTFPDQWEFVSTYLSTYAGAPYTFTIPGTFWADLGGTPMNPAGWTYCATLNTLPASASLDQMDLINFYAEGNDGLDYQYLFMDIQAQSSGAMSYDAQAYDDSAPSNYNEIAASGSITAPKFLAGVFNAETGDGTYWIDGSEAALDYQIQDLSTASAAAVDAIAPVGVEIGWGSFNATETQPVKGTAFPGITAWRMYRGMLTADQVAVVRTEMES